MKKLRRSLTCLALVLAMLLCMAPAALAADAGLSNFKTERTYDGRFTDVSSGSWYYTYVKSAYEIGLVSGKSDTLFGASANLTVAEAITLAARIHNIYHGSKTTFTQGSPWYQSYVDYALANDIIYSGEYTGYTQQATRAQFVKILAAALPDSALTAINSITSLPDVSASASYGPAVFKLYNAGILTGSDSSGTFYPSKTIVRSEVSAIIARMINTSLRKELPELNSKEDDTEEETEEDTEKETEKDTTTVTLGQSSLTLHVGDTSTLTASVAASTSTSQNALKISWSSSDAAVAEVSDNGTVTAKKAGKATIIAQAGSSKASCVVTVEKNEDSAIIYLKKYLLSNGTKDSDGLYTYCLYQSDSFTFSVSYDPSEENICLKCVENKDNESMKISRLFIPVALDSVSAYRGEYYANLADEQQWNGTVSVVPETFNGDAVFSSYLGSDNREEDTAAYNRGIDAVLLQLKNKILEKAGYDLSDLRFDILVDMAVS